MFFCESWIILYVFNNNAIKLEVTPVTNVQNSYSQKVVKSQGTAKTV